MVVPVSGRSSVTVITVSRLLLVSVHPLGNPDGNMDRHGFILIGLRRQSCLLYTSFLGGMYAGWCGSLVALAQETSGTR